MDGDDNEALDAAVDLYVTASAAMADAVARAQAMRAGGETVASLTKVMAELTEARGQLKRTEVGILSMISEIDLRRMRIRHHVKS